MRHVDRSKVKAPSSLSGVEGSTAFKEITKARVHISEQKKKSFEFKAYKGSDVRLALAALFSGKCAYCESDYNSTAPVDIEHYRPKGQVAEEPDHPGYWWLAAKWENLLSSCIDCNRARNHITLEKTATANEFEVIKTSGAKLLSGKKDSFPINGNEHSSDENGSLSNEDPLLIDPTSTDPESHLQWHLEDGVAIVLPKTLPDNKDDPYGNASIQVYGLNRIGLVAARTRVLRYLQFEANEILELLELAEQVVNAEVKQRLTGMALNKVRRLQDQCAPDAPYSAMAIAFVSKFEKQLEDLNGDIA